MLAASQAAAFLLSSDNQWVKGPPWHGCMVKPFWLFAFEDKNPTQGFFQWNKLFETPKTEFGTMITTSYITCHVINKDADT